MADHASICRNPSCEVARTGACALGNDPIDSCPEYDLEEAETLDSAQKEEAPIRDVAAKRVPIRPSEVMNENDLLSFRKTVRATTVSLVGDVKAGKTTLIASLYAQFCKGSFAGYTFRASRTLTGFARRHHLSLHKSNLQTPTTPRTSMADGVGFFHFNVVDGSADSIHLIISDRSGEAFRAARTNTTLVGDLRELKLADRVCFLLDADKLTAPEFRANYRREFKQTIWALLQNQAFSPDVSFEVLATKIDRLSKRGSGSEALLQELREFEESLIQELGQTGVKLKVFEICALPRANYGVGLIGIEELLKRWLEPSPAIDIRPLRPNGPARAIDRLLEFWSGERSYG